MVVLRSHAIIECENIKDNNDSIKANILTVQINRINSLIRSFETASFRNSCWSLFNESIIEDLDAFKDPIGTIIPMNNGYNIDIFTHKITLRHIGDKYTYSINAHIDPTIKTIQPTVDSLPSHHFVYDFFYKLMCEDRKYVEFFITMLGVYISGDIRDQSFMICIGEGNNGKSVLEKILSSLLGVSGGAIAPGVIYSSGTKENPNNHTSHLDAMKGLRLGMSCEAQKAKGWNKEVIKLLVEMDLQIELLIRKIKR